MVKLHMVKVHCGCGTYRSKPCANSFAPMFFLYGHCPLPAACHFLYRPLIVAVVGFCGPSAGIFVHLVKILFLPYALLFYHFLGTLEEFYVSLRSLFCLIIFFQYYLEFWGTYCYFGILLRDTSIELNSIAL